MTGTVESGKIQAKRTKITCFGGVRAIWLVWRFHMIKLWLGARHRVRTYQWYHWLITIGFKKHEKVGFFWADEFCGQVWFNDDTRGTHNRHFVLIRYVLSFVCHVVGLLRAIFCPVCRHVACQALTEIHFCTNPSNRGFSASSHLRVLCGSCRCLSSSFLASPADSDHRAFSAFCRCIQHRLGALVVGKVATVFRPAN